MSIRSINAFKWSVLGEASTRLIGPITLLVLAAMLEPEAFGVVAAATVVISLTQLLAEAGIGKALIQREVLDDVAKSTAFWLSAATGATFAGILFMLSPFVADYFREPRVEGVVQVLAAQAVLAALGSVPAGLLQREMEFRRIFWARLGSVLAQMLVSIPLAYAGYGLWSLVLGSLSGQLVLTGAMMLLANWRPSRAFSSTFAWQLLLFGRWVLLSGLLGWFYAWMDSVVVGRYLGPHDMGLYRTGSTLAALVFGLAFAPILPVLYSHLSRCQHDLGKVRATLISTSQSIALVAIPLALLMACIAESLTEILLGQEWAGIATVLVYLSLMHGASWLVGANGEAYRAIGRPSVESWVSAGLLGIYAITYFTSVQHGLEVFLAARFLLAMLALGAHILVARAVLGIPIMAWQFGRTFLASLAAWIAAKLVPVIDTMPVWELACKTGAFLLVLVAMLLLLDRGKLTVIASRIGMARRA